MSTTVWFGLPGQGHIIPFLPIAAELIRRGERVICYSTPQFETAIERTGAAFRPYGAGFPLSHARTLARFQRSPRSAARVQLETGKWALERLLPDIRAARPDYLMHDSLAAWGWYLAQALSQTAPLPTVALFPTLVINRARYQSHGAQSLPLRLRHLLGRIYGARTWTLARELSERYRLPPLDHPYQLMQNHGTLNLVFTSRAFQPDADSLDPAHYKFIGPSVSPRPDAPPFPFDQLDGRPLILISLGTAFNNVPSFYQSCLSAFQDTPWQIVMAVGSNFSPLASAPPPSNFIIRRFVPQLELLPRTSVFISHGGMNSVNEALYYNVPLVLIPQGADHFRISGRVVQLGAGIRLDKRTFTADHLRAAVQKILSDPAYRESAARIGDSLRATGGPVQAADEITTVVTTSVVAPL